jgi:thioredoxin 1
MSRVTDVTDDNFQQNVIMSSRPVLVHFWAPWLSASREVATVLDQIADEYYGKLKVCKLDTHANPFTTNNYGIRAMPTLLLFNGGDLVDTIEGVLSKTSLVSRLTIHIHV